jgi:hypothetical protein
MLTKASKLNRSILPLARSDTRGWATPKILAAPDWLKPAWAICSLMADMSTRLIFAFRTPGSIMAVVIAPGNRLSFTMESLLQ